MASEERARFGLVVRDLVVRDGRFVRPSGNVDWVRVAAEVDGVGYETLRKAVTGRRWPGRQLMERVAAALNVEPTVFSEYRLLEAQRRLDPSEVGLEEALVNAERVLERGQG